MKQTRRYHSPRRRQDAFNTRQDILDAALSLFAEKGYPRVTVTEIARRARVTARTVYTSVGGKEQILSDVIGRASAYSGGRETLDTVLATDDPQRALGLLVHGTRLGNESNQEVIRIARGTTTLTVDAREFWDRATREYRDLLGLAAEHLAGLGAMPPGFSVEEVERVLWFCLGFDSWTTVTRDFGYDWDKAEVWLRERVLTLLGPGGDRR